MTLHTGEQEIVVFPEEDNVSKKLDNLKNSIDILHNNEAVDIDDFLKKAEKLSIEEQTYILNYFFRKTMSAEQLFTMYHSVFNLIELDSKKENNAHLFMPYYMKLMEEIGEENITEVLGDNHEVANISLLAYEWNTWEQETNTPETSFTDYLWYRKDSNPSHAGTWTLEDVTGVIDIHEVIENTIESSSLHQAMMTARTEAFTPMQKEKLTMYVTAFADDLQAYEGEQPSEILDRIVGKKDIIKLSKERIAELLKVKEDAIEITSTKTIEIRVRENKIQITAEKNGKYSMTTPEGEAKVFSKKNIRGLRENIAVNFPQSETDLAA